MKRRKYNEGVVQNWITSLKLKWMLFKYLWLAGKIEPLERFIRSILCRKGFHQLIVGEYRRITQWSDKKPVYKVVRYLKCRWCLYMFFANAREKKKFETYKRGWSNTTKETVSAWLNKSSSVSKSEQPLVDVGEIFS